MVGGKVDGGERRGVGAAHVLGEGEGGVVRGVDDGEREWSALQMKRSSQRLLKQRHHTKL